MGNITQIVTLYLNPIPILLHSDSQNGEYIGYIINSSASAQTEPGYMKYVAKQKKKVCSTLL